MEIDLQQLMVYSCLQLSPKEQEKMLEELRDFACSVRFFPEVKTRGEGDPFPSPGQKLREDIPEQGLNPEEVLGQAPDREGVYFRMPRGPRRDT